jgi:hypothetical protein
MSSELGRWSRSAEDFGRKRIRHFVSEVRVKDGSLGMGDEIESLGRGVFLCLCSSTRRGVEVILFKKVRGVKVFVIDP